MQQRPASTCTPLFLKSQGFSSCACVFVVQGCCVVYCILGADTAACLSVSLLSVTRKTPCSTVVMTLPDSESTTCNYASPACVYVLVVQPSPCQACCPYIHASSHHLKPEFSWTCEDHVQWQEGVVLESSHDMIEDALLLPREIRQQLHALAL